MTPRATAPSDVRDNARCVDAFFGTLLQAKDRVLMTDLDGTLAPFSENRDAVTPFDGVRERLERLVREARTRLVVISGRPVGQVEAILRLAVPMEVWGEHGWERRRPSGPVERLPIPPAAQDALTTIRRSGFAVFDDVMETKRTGVAFHWRGLNVGTATLVREWAMGAGAASPRGTLHTVAFDGGVELRVPGQSKGDAVRTVLEEAGALSVAAAYMGDDATDEDAFLALRGRGLGVLVRPERRPSAARCWLRPPRELLAFLERWHATCTGDGR